MKLRFLVFLVPVVLQAMEDRIDYYLLDRYAPEYLGAKVRFDRLYAARKAEMEGCFFLSDTTDAEYIARVIREGRLNKVINLLNEKRWVDLFESQGPYNQVEACLEALNTAKNITHASARVYRIAEAGMLMALVLNNIPDVTQITKSQIHRAWKINKDASRVMALCRKRPNSADEIIMEHMQMIRTRLTKELAK